MKTACMFSVLSYKRRRRFDPAAAQEAHFHGTGAYPIAWRDQCRAIRFDQML